MIVSKSLKGIPCSSLLCFYLYGTHRFILNEGHSNRNCCQSTALKQLICPPLWVRQFRKHSIECGKENWPTDEPNGILQHTYTPKNKTEQRVESTLWTIDKGKAPEAPKMIKHDASNGLSHVISHFIYFIYLFTLKMCFGWLWAACCRPSMVFDKRSSVRCCEAMRARAGTGGGVHGSQHRRPDWSAAFGGWDTCVKYVLCGRYDADASCGCMELMGGSGCIPVPGTSNSIEFN